MYLYQQQYFNGKPLDQGQSFTTNNTSERPRPANSEEEVRRVTRNALEIINELKERLLQAESATEFWHKKYLIEVDHIDRITAVVMNNE